MTEILDLTPAMDLDTELTNGMDNNDDRHPMENEPPLPQDDSRPGTPHLTNSSWIKRRRLPYHEKEHLQRLDNYTALNALTVSEFSSLPSCDNPGCAEHHTPLNTPTKNNDNEFPTLPKTASLKRKDNESEFVSPPNRKLSKNQNTPLATDQNFKINLSNKFNALEIHDSEIDPVEGTSTATSVNNVNAVNNKKKPTTNATVNKSADLTKNLPPPVMLKITLDFREQMRVINNFMPKIRSKMTGEYFKLYCDTHDQYHELLAFLKKSNINSTLLNLKQKDLSRSALFHTTGSTTTERPSIKTDSPLLYEMTSLLRTSASPPMSPHQSSCSNHTAKENTAPREPQRTLKTLYYFTQDSKRTHD
ncbi:hypothetical protein TNCV_4304471 [Trichonephila clavipes]|nr:hypothetical protein TNCV_4304471 [Trichonephila clavipes]